MPGGGSWNKQNKIRSGSYINFVSVRGGSVARAVTVVGGNGNTNNKPSSAPSNMNVVLGSARLGHSVLG